MIEIKEKGKCTGCSACASICPRQCIKMDEDLEGFDYPLVDSKSCINCHMCEKVCPVEKMPESRYDHYTVCIQNKDENVRCKSSAGGLIGAVYKAVFERNGIVFGVGFDTYNIARFMTAENMEECFEHKLFASKYVPAELDGVFINVKKELSSGRLVCFAGLPCQVAGLKSYLNKRPENLWLIDLTCYGVPSRKLYREYLEFLESKYEHKIKDVRFRDKTFGYAAPTMCVELENGKVKSQNCAVKSYLRCFFSDIASRPSCYECPYKTLDRASDFTIGDMRSIHKFIPEMDDNLGTTVVYVHSEEGERIIAAIRDDIKISEIPIEGVLKTSGKKMVSCPKTNSKRDSFFSDMSILPYEKLIKKYCPPDVSEHMANITKGFLQVTGLNKTGILKTIKRL